LPITDPLVIAKNQKKTGGSFSEITKIMTATTYFMINIPSVGHNFAYFMIKKGEIMTATTYFMINIPSVGHNFAYFMINIPSVGLNFA
jgi:predicted fused transcriptional regulator/phosphomethylpyrimidine kinase